MLPRPAYGGCARGAGWRTTFGVESPCGSPAKATVGPKELLCSCPPEDAMGAEAAHRPRLWCMCRPRCRPVRPGGAGLIPREIHGRPGDGSLLTCRRRPHAGCPTRVGIGAAAPARRWISARMPPPSSRQTPHARRHKRGGSGRGVLHRRRRGEQWSLAEWKTGTTRFGHVCGGGSFALGLKRRGVDDGFFSLRRHRRQNIFLFFS